MKKSTAITLILLTGLVFEDRIEQFIFGDEVRNRYASWDDCVKDYTDPTKCEAERTQVPGGYRVDYYGPSYRVPKSTDRASNPSVVTHRAVGVSRGGFGASGGSHASS